MSGLLNSTIARKFAMALSGLFLVMFLAQHLTVNFTSVISEELFNNFSHFMGNNFVVQALLQPVLIFGVFFHFIMGIYLEIKNNQARNIKYVKYKGSANSTWVSRNMIFSGAVVLAFLREGDVDTAQAVYASNMRAEGVPVEQSWRILTGAMFSRAADSEAYYQNAMDLLQQGEAEGLTPDRPMILRSVWPKRSWLRRA